MLSKEYLLENFGGDTAENGPAKVCQKLEKVRKNIGAEGRGGADAGKRGGGKEESC